MSLREFGGASRKLILADFLYQYNFLFCIIPYEPDVDFKDLSSNTEVT